MARRGPVAAAGLAVLVALAAGLALWNVPGPRDDDDHLDVVWKVAPSIWLD